MATLTLTTPIRIGDLANGITLDKLDLISVSINWQQATPVVSIMLQHPTSKWTHTVTLTGTDGTAQWSAIKAALPNFELTILRLLETAGKLPVGTIS